MHEGQSVDREEVPPVGFPADSSAIPKPVGHIDARTDGLLATLVRMEEPEAILASHTHGLQILGPAHG